MAVRYALSSGSSAIGWVDTEGGRVAGRGRAASDDRRGEGHDGISIPMNYRKRNCRDFFMERKDVGLGTRRGIQTPS